MIRSEIQDLPLWERLVEKKVPMSFELELTARCNNDCRHCYINLSAGDERAQALELSTDEILSIAGQAVDMGSVWCLLTGGEPLLRKDFAEIYLGLKRVGLLVSVFSNACLVTPREIELFKTYPPRDLEVTVYGANRKTYEAVTRRPGSWDAFCRGLDLLFDAGLKVRLKAVALRSNIHEIDEIAGFCRERTKDYYRFDPFLHLRIDGDVARNEEIKAERLLPSEIVKLERADHERFASLKRGCDKRRLAASHVASHKRYEKSSDRLFQCGIGTSGFTVGPDGTFRLCSSLVHPGTTYDLRHGSLSEAWKEWAPKVLDMRLSSPLIQDRCSRCSLIDLCMWCPAHAALETGELDGWVDYFCEVAHARAAALGESDSGSLVFDESLADPEPGV